VLEGVGEQAPDRLGAIGQVSLSPSPLIDFFGDVGFNRDGYSP
jgi:hypothetical protein